MVDPNFFVASKPLSLGEIADLAGATPGSGTVSPAFVETGCSLSAPQSGALAFAEGKHFDGTLPNVDGLTVLVQPGRATNRPDRVTILECDRPMKAFYAVVDRLYPGSATPRWFSGVVASGSGAFIHPDAMIEDNVSIAPGVVIGARAEIGRGTVIGPNTTIADGCQIGRRSTIGANVTIQCALIGDNVIIHPGARIGQDGFGFRPNGPSIAKTPQLGRVIIQNDVEIGSNTTVDRGALDDTTIGEGTKIDNLVQIAHNVTIGRMCLIAATVGIAGSTSIGDGTMIGGAAAIADHVRIGRGVKLAALAGVMNDIPDGARYSGAPAQPSMQHFREIAMLKSLTRQRGK